MVLSGSDFFGKSPTDGSDGAPVASEMTVQFSSTVSSFYADSYFFVTIVVIWTFR